MQQQINLYVAEFRPNRSPLRTIHMLWGLLGVFFVLILITVLTHFQYKQLHKEFTQLEQLQKSLNTQLQTMLSAKPELSGPELDVTIEKLQRDLQHRHHLASVITSQNLGNQKGFSAQLLALANASLSTISLESISLQNGGSYAEFSGKAVTADQIPLYLQKLRADPNFAKVGFGVMNVERTETSNGVLHFSLAKAAEDKAIPSNSAPTKPAKKDPFNVLLN